MPPHALLEPLKKRFSQEHPNIEVALTALPWADAMVDAFPEERAAVAAAVPKRQREFFAGRALSRSLLDTLGQPRAPLVPLEDRRPDWPSAVVGSISHTDGICGVAMAPSKLIDGLGLDIEGAAPLEPKMERMLLTDGEQAQLNAMNPLKRGERVKLIFSAKEAFYKAQYRLTRTFLDFRDVSLKIDPTHARFQARVHHPIAERLAPYALEGFYFWAERWVFTGMVLRSG